MTEFSRQVLDALPMTVYTTDLEGRLTSTNRSWSEYAAINGAPRLTEETRVCGQSLWSAIGDPAYTAQMHHALELLRSGASTKVSWEFPCSSPDEERVFLMNITALREEERVTGFVFSTVDISPSHRSREALIDTGLALSRTIDLDRVFYEVGHQLQRAVGAEHFAVLLNSDDGATLKRTYSVGYPDDGAALDQRLVPLAQHAMERTETVARHANDGVEIVAAMSGGEGMIGAMTLFIEGETTRQQIEEAQRFLATVAAQTAVAIERARLVKRVGQKRRLEAIGEVAAGVAHELRNPLFGISSAAQLLRFRVKEDPVVEKNVGRILREVDRLNRMVTSLLEYGRPKPIALAAGDPDAIWEDVLDGQRGLFESRTLSLRRTRPDHGAVCRVDPEQLAQVFLNVLVNAVDHAPQGSEISLLSQTEANGSWRCRLSNGGPSIPPDVLPRLFEIFFSNKPGGTGIGLALCQRIIEEHGGEISIDSSPDGGTTLTISLPVNGA